MVKKKGDKNPGLPGVYVIVEESLDRIYGNLKVMEEIIEKGWGPGTALREGLLNADQQDLGKLTLHGEGEGAACLLCLRKRAEQKHRSKAASVGKGLRGFVGGCRGSVWRCGVPQVRVRGI